MKVSLKRKEKCFDDVIQELDNFSDDVIMIISDVISNGKHIPFNVFLRFAFLFVDDDVIMMLDDVISWFVPASEVGDF